MAETSKNKIYYNDNENSVADVLTDMKKMAESTDEAIEKSKYDDTQTKKDISNIQKEQITQNTDISNIKKEQETQNTNIEENNSKIVELQTEKAKLEKELKEMQEDFYQASIRGQASGEYIHVEDSSNCRAKIGIGGNHEQETRSGKNYLNTLAKYKAGDTVTIEGITYTFNNDGSITLNGTASATANSNLDFSVDAQKINGTNKKIVGLLTGSQVPSKMALTAYTSTWGANPTLTFSEVNKSLTINMQSNAEYTIFRISVYSGTTVNNQTVYYQILDTSVNDLTYEQYGASPSPNYPSEVKCVGSNINIFDKDNPDMFLNGLTPDNSGNIVSTLTDTTKTNYIITIIVPCKGNKQYTISRWLSGKTFIVYESEKNKFNINDKVTLLKRNDNSGIINETIATSANAKYILVKIYSTWVNEENTYNDLISSIKIEKGTVATPWSQHGQGCIKVTKCNKNIYNKNKEIICNGVGVGSSGELFSRSDQKLLIIPISKLETNIAISLTKTFSYSLRYAFSDKIVENIDCKIFNTGYVENSTTINIKVNKTVQNNKHNYLLLSFTKKDSYPDLQVEYKKEVSQYEEHQGQSYIMPTQQSFKSVGDIRDTFIKKDGKWYERHNIYRYLFTGNENFKALDNNSIFGMRVTENKAKIVSKNSSENLTNCLSNRFVNNTQSNTAKMSNKIAFSQWSDAQFLYLSKIKDSVGELKSYLAANETYVDYPLETPIDIECTEEQSKILDELTNARTYKNVTNITTDSKAILSLDYVKDQETQNNKMQNEIDEIKQLLSTTQTSALLLDNMQTDIESEVE